MARINPYSLRPITETTRTFTVTDPAQPGQELTVTFRSTPDLTANIAVADAIVTLKEQYLTGSTVNGKFIPPAVVDMPGLRVTVTNQLCHLIGQMMTWQVPAEGEAPYSFPEWCIIAATMPVAFRELMDGLTDMNTPEDELKNEAAVSTETPSKPPSEVESGTPNLSQEPTP